MGKFWEKTNQRKQRYEDWNKPIGLVISTTSAKEGVFVHMKLNEFGRKVMRIGDAVSGEHKVKR